MAEQNNNENGNITNDSNKKKQKGVNKSTSGSKIGGESSKKKKQLLRNQRPDGDWPETEEKEEVLEEEDELQGQSLADTIYGENILYESNTERDEVFQRNSSGFGSDVDDLSGSRTGLGFAGLRRGRGW